MSDSPKYLAVYLPEHDGEPIALIRADLPGNHATELVRALRMAAGGTVHVAATDSAGFKRSADVAEMLAAPATPAGAPPPDPDAPARAAIRARLAEDERQSRLEAEVRREMAAQRRESPAEPEAAPAKGR